MKLKIFVPILMLFVVLGVLDSLEIRFFLFIDFRNDLSQGFGIIGPSVEATGFLGNGLEQTFIQIVTRGYLHGTKERLDLTKGLG